MPTGNTQCTILVVADAVFVALSANFQQLPALKQPVVECSGKGAAGAAAAAGVPSRSKRPWMEQLDYDFLFGSLWFSAPNSCD